MQLLLEAIKFNHDPGFATGDAFGIRRNETQAVTPPEWERGRSLNPEDSPAAYASSEVKDQILTIKARFSSDLPKGKIWIRAVDGKLFPIGRSRLIRIAAAVLTPLLRRLSQSNVLGEVKAKQVEFVYAESDYVSFELQNVRIQQAGVGIDDIVWRWQFSNNGRAWNDFTITTHRIYTVVGMPGPPWEPNAGDSNTQLPWIGVLDHACRWAAGAKDLESVAFQITKSILLLGPAFVQYDIENGGGPHFTPDDPLRFDCQKFLDLLKFNNPAHRLVNCDDCAAIVSAFANVLGCSFPESIIKSPNVAEFSLRRHQKIGLDWENFDQFDFHVIAWTGADQDEVSDACLKLDGSGISSGEPLPRIASNIPFAGDGGYRDLLVLEGEDCALLRKFSRRIGMAAQPVQSEILETERQTLRLVDSFREMTELDSWAQIDLRYVPLNMVETYWRLSEGSNKTVLRLDIQVSPTPKVADDKLMHQLSRFELPGVKQKEGAGFGRKVFAKQSGFVILFSRNQFVCLLRNVGTTFVPMWDVARIVDTILLSFPNQ